MTSSSTERKTYIAAFASSELAKHSSPDMAVIFVSNDFLDRLNDLSRLCEHHKLSEMRVYESPYTWEPKGIGGELRLQCAELVVTATSFWYVDQPKGCNYHIQTRAQNLSDFRARVEAARADEVLCFGEKECDRLELELEAPKRIHPHDFNAEHLCH